MTKVVKPISPKAVGRAKQQSIPSVVFACFNELIAKNYFGGSARVTTKEVVRLLVRKGLKETDIFSNHWLNVEEAYAIAGWTVKYDKPGYDECYDSYFLFRR